MLAALADISNEFHKIPANQTHLCQPFDQLIIKYFKGIWRKNGSAKNLAIKTKVNNRAKTGRVLNLGNLFYLELNKEYIEQLNKSEHSPGSSLVDVRFYPEKRWSE